MLDIMTERLTNTRLQGNLQPQATVARNGPQYRGGRAGGSNTWEETRQKAIESWVI